MATKPTKTQKEALEFYQGQNYEVLNNHLRGTMAWELNATNKKMLNDQASRINSTMKPLKENIEVHRGMWVGDEKSQRLLDSWQPGATFREKGFISTSIDESFVKKNFSMSGAWGGDLPKGRYAVDIRMRLPAGTPVTYMNAVLPKGNTKEHELLLGSGLNYRVIGRKDNPGGRVEIDIEILP